VGFCCFAVVVFVVSSFFTGCWLESSERVFIFFREVFVLFSFNFRSSFVYVWSEHHCGFAVVFMNGFVASSVRCLFVFF
jgi:hypothetical protein